MVPSTLSSALLNRSGGKNKIILATGFANILSFKKVFLLPLLLRGLEPP